MNPIDAPWASCVLVVRDLHHLPGHGYTSRLALVISRKDGSGFAFPGGKGEPGETPKTCACRELHEEVGVAATPGRLVLLHKGQSPSGRLVHLYYAIKITNAPHAVEYGTTMGWFPFDQLLNSSPFSPLYREVFPDGIDHLRATEILVLP